MYNLSTTPKAMQMLSCVLLHLCHPCWKGNQTLALQCFRASFSDASQNAGRNLTGVGYSSREGGLATRSTFFPVGEILNIRIYYFFFLFCLSGFLRQSL